MLPRMIAIACVAIALAPPQLAAADLNRPRSETQLQTEATLFFADVLLDLNRGHGPCTFSAEWARYPVWAELFDVPIHGYLAPLDHRSQLPEILDPAGQRPGWLCDDAEIGALIAAATELLAAQPAPTSTVIRYHELTFPIFSENFDRAAIVLMTEERWLDRPAGGDPPFVRGISGGGSALIYERQDGQWTRVARYRLYSFH